MAATCATPQLLHPRTHLGEVSEGGNGAWGRKGTDDTSRMYEEIHIATVPLM